MAIIKQNFFTKNLQQWLPTKPFSKTLALTPPISHIITYSTYKNFTPKLTLNSTNGNYNGFNGQYEYEKGLIGAGQQSQNPRPSEIVWKKELCNLVQLIGIVGTPVECKELSSGKVVAWCRLAVKKSATDTTW